MVFEYSYWWIVLIALLSAGVARAKYKKIFTLPDVSIWINLLVTSIRFLTIFLLLFLLLKPALLLYRNIKEKPLLIIAQDNSESLVNNKDSLYFKSGEYKKDLERKIAPLEDKFSVEWLTFGKNIHEGNEINFSEHYTDISGVFTHIDNHYKYRQPAAVLLLSDGIYNTGINPRYKTNSYPVYSIALGDTTEFPDVYIKNALCDKFNFLNTIFPVKVDISAVKQHGKEVSCVLKENGKVIDSKKVYINGDNFFTEVVFEVEAKQKGIRKYTVALETTFTEHSRENNSTVLYTNILDNSGGITIYYSSPHPDISAITGAIRATGIYTHEMKNFDEAVGEISSNLLIMHNPSADSPAYRQIASIVTKRKIPVWYVLTERQHISHFSGTGKDYSVTLNLGVDEYVTPGYNRSFPLFEFSEQEIQGFMNYPPLVVPFGEIKSHAGKELFIQRVKNVDTRNALMSFYDKDSHKTCYLWGEGIWRWRMFSFRENGSHDLFNSLVHKTINYLIARKGNDRFIHDIKALYDETEAMVINVELYNESYELVNTPDVHLQLKTGEKDFNYILSRNGDKYQIDLGNLAAGEYSYWLKTNLKGENLEKRGTFLVRSQNPELNDMIAEWHLLKEIANHSGGLSSNWEGLDKMAGEMVSQDLKVLNKKEAKYIELGELKWLGIILLLLLCIEWFLLKYFTD